MRIETGVIQFGDDWPGLFVRGDDAFAFAMAIRQMQELMDKHEVSATDSLAFRALDALAWSLERSNVRSKHHHIDQSIKVESVLLNREVAKDRVGIS